MNIFDLSKQEINVLGWMCEGLAAKEIAKQLVISESTVNFHTGNIYKKLRVKTARQAMKMMNNSGLLDKLHAHIYRRKELIPEMGYCVQCQQCGRKEYKKIHELRHTDENEEMTFQQFLASGWELHDGVLLCHLCVREKDDPFRED